MKITKEMDNMFIFLGGYEYIRWKEKHDKHMKCKLPLRLFFHISDKFTFPNFYIDWMY